MLPFSVPWYQYQYAQTLDPKTFVFSGYSLLPSIRLSGKWPKALLGKEWKYCYCIYFLCHFHSFFCQGNLASLRWWFLGPRTSSGLETGWGIVIFYCGGWHQPSVTPLDNFWLCKSSNTFVGREHLSHLWKHHGLLVIATDPNRSRLPSGHHSSLVAYHIIAFTLLLTKPGYYRNLAALTFGSHGSISHYFPWPQIITTPKLLIIVPQYFIAFSEGNVLWALLGNIIS